MLRSLWTGASGMTSMQLYIDTISNNLANVNTVGYKQDKANFQDLLYEEVLPSGAVTSTGINHPTGIQVGLGVKPSSVTKVFTQGSPIVTENDYDVAILGNGFFQIELPDGETGYTRDGTFKLDSEGAVVTSDGYYVMPRITVPEDASLFTVGRGGTVSVSLPNTVEPTELGQIELVTFVNQQGLQSIGQNLFMETVVSGTPQVGLPESEHYGSLMHRATEASNVNVVTEMVDMISGQRAYEFNSRSIQSSDDMLQTVISLKR